MSRYLSILLFVVFSIVSLSCMTSPHVAFAERPSAWALPIDPQANLYQVDTHLFRSQQPVLSNKDEISRLQIKTIINLRYKQTDQDIFDQSSIHLINVPMHTWAIDDKQIAQALIQINTAMSQGNVLLHCEHGADRTGIVVAMYRIIYQQWPVNDAKQEMKHGGFGFHPIWINILQFFEPQHIQNIKAYIKAEQASGLYNRQVYSLK